MRFLQRSTAAMLVFAWTSVASAGGYDTPMLYSARHLGMGGAAVSYVDDPSAMFHNPAGLANIGRGAVLLDVSPAIGSIQASPRNLAQDQESETTFAPFFLLGGAARVHKWVTLGLAVYPVASAGAEYRYEIANTPNIDKTRLIFIEASPGVAINLPGGFNLGLGYRATLVQLERKQGALADPATNFDLSGVNLLGFRFGAQWHGQGLLHATDSLSVGASYRTKTETDITADSGRALGFSFTDVEMQFTLPSRLIFGTRYDIYDLGVALDVEYGFNSQNQRSVLFGTCALAADDPLQPGCAAAGQSGAPNVFRWVDAWTIRPGLEYRLLDDSVPLRVGYIWDQATSNPSYPTAFGTPPGPSHVVTLGAGYKAESWQVNMAYAYRTVTGAVTDEDTAAREEVCPFCSVAGQEDYQLALHGIYLDASYHWL